MRGYFALVEHEEGSAFGVRFPDLPNVFSGADEAGDIVARAIEALQLWAEDMPMPEPSTHAQIIARDDIRAELAEGAWLIEVPFIENDAAVVRANVTFERGMLRAIDNEASERGLTRASFLAQAARHEIERAPVRYTASRPASRAAAKAAAAKKSASRPATAASRGKKPKA